MCVRVIACTEHVRNSNTDNGVYTHAVLKMEQVSNSDEENEHQMDGTTVKRRRRDSKFCDHCKQFVSKSTFYRHCLEQDSGTQPPISPSESLTDLVDTANIEDESLFEASIGKVALYLNCSSARTLL